MKKLFISFGIILAMGSIYFGSLLPFSKAQKYIGLINASQSNQPRLLSDIIQDMDSVVNFYSPAGQEEVVRYITNDILNVVLQTSQSEKIDRTFVEYIEPHIFKNDVRHLLVMGEIYKALWEKYKKENDYYKAEGYYLKSLGLAPRLPQALDSAFDLYQVRGDREKMRGIGEVILRYWPDDIKTREALEKAGSN